MAAALDRSAWGRPADIVGQTVTAAFAKIHGQRQHFFVVELEFDPSVNGEAARSVADVDVSYRDLLRNRTAEQKVNIAVQFTKREADVEARANPKIAAELGLLNADAATERALQLRDAGDIEGASRVLSESSAKLAAVAHKSKDTRLTKKINQQRNTAEQVKQPENWNIERKAMKQNISDDLLNGL